MKDSKQQFIDKVSFEIYRRYSEISIHPDHQIYLTKLSTIGAWIAYDYSNSKAQGERSANGIAYQNKVFNHVKKHCESEFNKRNYLWINGSTIKREHPDIHSELLPRHGTTLTPKISDTDMLLWDCTGKKALLIVSSKVSFRERGNGAIAEMKHARTIHPNLAVWVVTPDHGTINTVDPLGKRVLEIRRGKKAYVSLNAAGIRIYTSNPDAITEDNGLQGVFSCKYLIQHIRTMFLS